MNRSEIGILTLVLAIVGIIVIAVVVGRLAPAPGPAGPPSDPDAIAANNRAVGLMGRYEYEVARVAFAELVEAHPGWVDVRVNLAIATLNRQRDGDEVEALRLLDEALAVDPSNLRAQYCGGLLRLYLESPADALAHFRHVGDADPRDAYAAYYVGQCLAQLQQYEEAVAWYERATAVDPYLRSAYYGLSQSLLRLGRRDDARAALETFNRLEDNPRARTVKFVYTKMGPKGTAATADLAASAPAPRPDGPPFRAATPLLAGDDGGWRAPRDDRPVSVTACDVNGDGALDLFLADALRRGDDVSSALLVADGRGGWVADPSHVLATVTDVNAALWGDWDNDGLVDVYLCRRGPNQLWRQVEAGRWEDETASSGTDGGELDTVDGAMVDADHDGDLDLFCVNADGPDELLNNNLDGTFRPLAAERGLAGGDRPSRQVVVGDLDHDRDADLLVLHDAAPHSLFLNDRGWTYRRVEWTPAGGVDVAAVVAADLDADGRPELHTLAADGAVHRWTSDDGVDWRATETAAARADAAPAGRAQLAVADVDGDGRAELLATRRGGWRVVPADDATPAYTAEAEGLAGWTLAVTDPGRGPAVVGARADGGPVVWRPGPGRHAFTTLAFTGREDQGDGMRSNASGIGVRAEIRIGSRWQVVDTFRRTSGPGQGLQPLPVGLGGADAIDFVRLDWPDGVLQSELHAEAPPEADRPPRDFSAGRVERIEEIQRQKSSCPVLFAWDGARYRFVSDLLGVGGIGFALGPGEYATPRPWENFLLPAGLPAARDGRYVLKIGEPMEEACYLDGARLVVWDLPPGWDLTVDERLATAPPAPTGAVLTFDRSQRPARATNDRGEDVTARVRDADLDAAPPGPRDRRFIGRLAAPHALTLTFDAPLDAGPGDPVLVLDGWVEYPYSQTMFAASQAGAAYEPPTLEARGADGAWRVVHERFGYPAGMPRQMSVPLDDLPAGTTALRLVTNQQVYWDRVAVVRTRPCPEARRREAPLVAARLRAVGFPRRTTGPQRQPHYDYDDRRPVWDTRHQAGLYTRFGPVDELVADTDDALAIFGPGEEVHLEFAAPAGPPPGWTRRVVLEATGWCKDMDLYTRDGETLAPLPAEAALAEPFNIRFDAGE
ncbi:MAG: FG-GAP-like repeat-containing protein [Planctomycetota bacterium]|jgi:tetratricopeptide (TPR) repeat protein